MSAKDVKGLTTRLTWQTARFFELERLRDDLDWYFTRSRLVEDRFDGVTSAARIPGGVALRFARVFALREDQKWHSDADR